MRRRRRKSLRTHLVRERRSPRHSDTSLRRIPDVVEEPTQSSDADSSPVIDVDDVIIVDPPAFIEDSHVDLDGDEDGPPPVRIIMLAAALFLIAYAAAFGFDAVELHIFFFFSISSRFTHVFTTEFCALD